MQHSKVSTEQATVSPPGRRPDPTEIRRFEKAMAQMDERWSIGEESTLNGLLDLFVCHCRHRRDLVSLRDSLLAVLAKRSPRSVTVGVFEERFAFHPAQGNVRITVDQMHLAEISRDIASRLADMLRPIHRASGARDNLSGRIWPSPLARSGR